MNWFFMKIGKKQIDLNAGGWLLLPISRLLVEFVIEAVGILSIWFGFRIIGNVWISFEFSSICYVWVCTLLVLYLQVLTSTKFSAGAWFKQPLFHLLTFLNFLHFIRIYKFYCSHKLKLLKLNWKRRKIKFITVWVKQHQ